MEEMLSTLSCLNMQDLPNKTEFDVFVCQWLVANKQSQADCTT